LGLKYCVASSFVWSNLLQIALNTNTNEGIIMTQITKLLIMLGMFAFVSQSVSARPLTTEEKIRDFEQLVTVMKSGYGPLEYKKETQGIDIRRQEHRYLRKVVKTKSNTEYYHAVSEFVASFNDSHFSARIPSDYRGSLGFMADLVEGKVILIHTKQFPNVADAGLVDGDEIISFGGKPVLEVVNELSKYIGMGYEKSSKRIGAWLLSSRKEGRMPVPTGVQKMTVRKLQSREVIELDIEWSHTGTPIGEADADLTESLATPVDHFDLSIYSLIESLGLDDLGPTFMCSPGTRTPIPDDATIIMMQPFVAYYHSTPKGNVGYLRIPHYSPANGEFDLRLAQYQYAVSILEENTEGLIIDQGHNCGGSVSYLGDIAGLFIEETTPAMPFELLGSKATLAQMSDYLAQTPVNTLEYALMTDIYTKVKDAWENGSFLSEKTSFTGPILGSNVTRYTKPIVMLIDELSGSGGDAFPSLLGGIGRATLFGERTMGAGGHVTPITPLPFSNISVNMTKSLFYRPDGVPVENNGAVPHIQYEIKASDAVNGFTEYQKAYLKALSDLIAEAV
jgi:hypothetical protein